MIAFESSEQLATSVQKEGEEKERRLQYEQAKERYGFRVSFIDNNSVHVRDACGINVAFEFPLDNETLDEYDKFIQQMQSDNLSPPPIEDLRMVIRWPRSDALRDTPDTNAPTQQSTWEEHAEKHGISTDEMQQMYLFAREELYARYKSRLRN